MKRLEDQERQLAAEFRAHVKASKSVRVTAAPDLVRAMGPEREPLLRELRDALARALHVAGELRGVEAYINSELGSRDGWAGRSFLTSHLRIDHLKTVLQSIDETLS